MRSHLSDSYLDDANPLAGEDYNDEPTVGSLPAPYRPRPSGLGEVTLPGGIRMPVGTLVAILGLIAAVAIFLYLRNRK